MVNTQTMLYVGRFTEKDLIAGKDKEAIRAKEAAFPSFKYIFAEKVFKGRKLVALDVYLSHLPV